MQFLSSPAGALDDCIVRTPPGYGINTYREHFPQADCIACPHLRRVDIGRVTGLAWEASGDDGEWFSTSRIQSLGIVGGGFVYGCHDVSPVSFVSTYSHSGL